MLSAYFQSQRVGKSGIETCTVDGELCAISDCSLHQRWESDLDCPVSDQRSLEEPIFNGSAHHCFDGREAASGALGQQVSGQVKTSGDKGVTPVDRSAAAPPSNEYTLPSIITSICPADIRLLPRHLIGGVPSQMNINAWDYYLDFEADYRIWKYLHDGVLHGFAIVDEGELMEPYFCDNYSSVLNGEAFIFVNDLIMSEIRDGKYVKATSMPHCVHALEAIPKSDGTFRPITDCRRPEGTSINNYMNTTFLTFNYITIDQVASNVTEGCFMATVDISSAYRSVSIQQDQWTY